MYGILIMFLCEPGKVNVKDEELDEMLNEGKGPINFTVFLTLFGEKLNGENLRHVLKQICYFSLMIIVEILSDAFFSCRH